MNIHASLSMGITRRFSLAGNQRRSVMGQLETTISKSWTCFWHISVPQQRPKENRHRATISDIIHIELHI